MSRLMSISLSVVAAVAIGIVGFVAYDVQAQSKSKTEVMPAAASDPKTTAVKTELVKRFPELRDAQLKKVEFGGLYEIVINGSEIFYTDEKVSHLILGGIVDANSRVNITEERIKQLTAVKWDDLPLDAAIKTVRGTGARKVAVFADPFCGYCKRFEADLAKVNDVTVYTYLLPIIRPESRPVSEKVWCAKDRSEAWLGLMLKGQEPTGDGKCETPIDKVLAIGTRYKITGTPTMIFENGERAPGALSTAQIEAGLVKAAAKKS